ncbi:TPA: discoidin domain-containing protein [Streptococcus suis]|nr:discoidin domain-containing protein [Streptococcus suis]
MNRVSREYQYSIRKTTFGVGSVVVGVMLAGMLHAPAVLANTISEPTTSSLSNHNPSEVSVEESTVETATDKGAVDNVTVERAPEFAVSESSVGSETNAANEVASEEALISPVEIRAAIESVTATSHNPSEGGSRDAIFASDNNDATYWSSATNQDNREGNRQYLTVKLEEPARVSQVAYTPRQNNGAYAVGNLIKGRVLYSLDGVDYQPVTPTEVASTRGQVNASDKTFTVQQNNWTKVINFNEVTAQYLRLEALETAHWDANQRNLRVTAADFIPTNPVRTVSNLDLVSASISATSEHPNDSGRKPASNAADNNANTYWASDPAQDNSNPATRQMLTLTFNEPAYVNAAYYTPRSPSTAVGNIKTGYLEYQASADSDWQRVTLTGVNTDNVFTFGQNIQTKELTFNPVIAHALRLVALTTHHHDSSKVNKEVAASEFKANAYKVVEKTVEESRPIEVVYVDDANVPVGTPDRVESEGEAGRTLTTTKHLTRNGKALSEVITGHEPVVVEVAGQPRRIVRATGSVTPDSPEIQPEQPGETKPVVESETPTVVSTETIRVENQEIALQNEYISRKMIVKDGKLRTVSISNKLTSEEDDIQFLEDSKEFVIQFKPTATDTEQPPVRPGYVPEAEDRSQWTVSASSQANAGAREGNVNYVVDGDLNTIWHNNYHSAGTGPQRTLPAHVDLTFPEAKEVRTFIYVPRQDGPATVNGLTKGYKVYIKQGDATDFTLLKEGTITENPKSIQYIDFGEVKQNVKAIRFETTTAQNNQPFAAAAELDVSRLTAEEIKAKQVARETEYQKQLDAFLSRTQISLDKLTLAENGIEKVVTDVDQTITYTFNPFTYKDVPVTIKYVMNLRKDAKFTQSHLLISVPEQHRSSLAIDTIDLQSFKLPVNQTYEEFSNQAPIAEMAQFDGFHAGLGQPVYMGSFYTGSEFPIAWNSVEATTKHLFSRYYSGKNLAELSLDENGNYRTWNTVVGVARSNEYSVLQQDFYDYIAKIGTKTYFRKQYNSWYDLMKNITAENIKSSFNEIDRGFTNGGISPLDSFVVDDGWQKVSSVWDFNEKFPNKLYDSSKQVQRFGSDFGLWMGPRGGYGTEGEMARHLVATGKGSATPAGDVYIGDKRYVDALKVLFEKYGQEFDINYWKLDGMLRYPQHTTDTNGNYIGGGYKNMYSMTEAHERWIDLYEIIRANAPTRDDAWINLTSYIPPSPWFLQWVNSIWMQNTADVDYQDGVKRAPNDNLDFGNDANEALSYRDDSYEKLIRNRKWQIPFSNIYNHDPVYGATAHSSKKMSPMGPARGQINFSTEDFRTYLYMLGTRGTGFWEFYYSPSMLDDAKWQVNGEAVKWIESNFETLRNSVFHGGQPREGEVYGYSSWDADNGIVSIRNPIDREQTYELQLNRIVGMREGTANMYRTTVLGDKRHDTSAVTNYNDTLRITLRPYESVVFQYSKVQDTRPAEVFEAKAIADNKITLEFDERVVIDGATFEVAGHTISSTELNANLRTVTLNLSDRLTDCEKVVVRYSNVKDNTGTANISTGTANLTAYSGGIIHDISQVNPSQTLVNDGVEGRGVFSVTTKVTLDRLNQTIAEQEGQWKLSVDADGRAVFEVKGETVKSAPFTELSTEDTGRADKLIVPNEEVTITAVRVPNGSLRIYINGELHNSHYNPNKINEALERSTLSLAADGFAGTVSRFILENGARDFATAKTLARELSPVEELRPADMNEAGTSAPSHDPNDGGPRPAGSATDGNPNTYWASSQSADNRTTRQTLTIEMANPGTVGEVRYVPRLRNLQATGDIRKASLEYSLDGQTWSPVSLKEGNGDGTIGFIPGKPYHSILFDPVEAKYFRLTAHETHHWNNDLRNKIVAVAELTPIVLFVPEHVERLTTAYLRNAIEQAKALDSAAYTSDSYAKVLELLPSSEAGLAATTQGAIDSANTALRTALAQLVPVEETGSRTLTDAATGVRLDLQANELDSIIGLRVTHKEGIVNVPEALLDKDYDLFDIELVNETGQIVANTLPVRVSLPVDSGKKVEKVLYLPTSGDKVELAFTESVRVSADGNPRKEVIFTANHFSDYAIVYSDTAMPTSFIDWFATEVGDLDGDKDVDKADVQLWLKGEKGAKGEKGDPGAPGTKGDPGATGPAGVAGPKGDTGPTGPAGVAGPKGDTGAAGPAGVAGPKGDTGATGPVGVAGPKGDTGATGPAGVAGPKGDTGVTGPVGPQGPKGDTGATGPVGPQGPKGDTGATGPVGPQGSKGDAGVTTTTPLEEELVTAKGESLLQPALPAFDGGIVPNVAPTAEALPLGVLPEEEIITAKGESVKAPALPKLDLSAIKASHAPAIAQAEAKKEEKASLPNTGVEAELALTALGAIGLLATSRLVSRKRY